MSKICVKLEGINKEVDKISRDLASHSHKMEYLENQSRRNNICVNGIPESDNETWEDAEVKVKRTIKDNLGIKVDIERAHRVERQKAKSGQANGTSQPSSFVHIPILFKTIKYNGRRLHCSRLVGPDHCPTQGTIVPTMHAIPVPGRW